MKTNNIIKKLENFNGSKEIYKHGSTDISYTEGIRFLAKTTESYWLIDAIGSYQNEKTKNVKFQTWKLVINENNTAVLTMSYDRRILIKQYIKYTNSPLKNIEMWLINNILMLPSEC